jgi:hypothetical protein
MSRIIISESDRQHIKRLYEQAKPFNLFTYKETIKSIIDSMSSLMENKVAGELCKNLDGYLKPTFGLVNDLLSRISADTGMSEGEAIKYVYNTWKEQKSGGMPLLMKLIGGNVSVGKEMVDKLFEHIRTKENGSLLSSIISDIFGSANIKQIPMCSQ